MIQRALARTTVLVIGGGGFLGAATLRALAAHGATLRTVLCAPGQPSLAPPAGVHATHAEVDDARALLAAAEGVDVVVHVAGGGSIAAPLETPAAYARVYTSGTAAVLAACARGGVRRLVYVSSADVYGQPRENPVREDHPLQPRSPWGAVRLGAEAMVQTAVQSSAGLEAMVLRPFAVYGPAQPVGSLLGRILEQALHGDAITPPDPRLVRDYCYVDDVAEALLRACALRAVPGPPASPRVYNLGSGEGTSVAGLTALALAAAGRALPVRDDPSGRRPRGTEVLSLVADASRAAHELGWRARTPLSEGLRRTVAWLRSHGSAWPMALAAGEP